MRTFLTFLIILAITFSSFGLSHITIERTWSISSSTPYEFSGALVANDSNQRVLAVYTDEDVVQYTDENGTIWLKYKGSASKITGKAIVEINYDTNIISDPSFLPNPLPSTNLTSSTTTMRLLASSLAERNSSLRTIAALTNWVHNNMQYDISYVGQIKNAPEVFKDLHGVCSEYTHLMISLARSLGFESRYVGGYVFSDSWQPHAWSEIYLPSYGWLAADPTFGQVGILDNSHVAIYRGDDQLSTYDTILSNDKNATLEVSDTISSGISSTDEKGTSLDLKTDDYYSQVTITNDRPDFVFGSYAFIIQKDYGVSESLVLLLEPNQVLKISVPLNRSIISPEFQYYIPVTASFNDAKDSGAFVIDVTPSNSLHSLCSALLILPILLLLSLRLAG